MRIYAETKATITVVSTSKKGVALRTEMPDGSVTERFMTAGDTYINTVKIDLDIPVDGFTSFSLST